MKLVVEEKIKTLNKSGDENILFTNETISTVEDIITKETEYDANNVEFGFNEETFLSKVGTQEEGYEFIYYDEEGWFINDQSVDIAEYGIEMYGEPYNGDKIFILVADEKVVEKQYIVHHTVLEGVECRFLDFTSDVDLDVELVLGEETINITTRKIQMNFNWTGINLDIWTTSKKPFKVKTVVSK